jgi:hypothetical protein
LFSYNAAFVAGKGNKKDNIAIIKKREPQLKFSLCGASMAIRKAS